MKGTSSPDEAEELLRSLGLDDTSTTRLPWSWPGANRSNRLSPNWCISSVNSPAEPEDDHQRWLNIMPPEEGDWAQERRSLRAQIRVLPRSLKRRILKLRKEHLQAEVLESIYHAAQWIAHAQGCLVKTIGEPDDLAYCSRTYVPAVETTQILNELATDAAFGRHLDGLVNRLLRTARDLRLWSRLPEPSELPVLQLPSSGYLRAPTRLGLSPWVGTPEGLLTSIARRVLTLAHQATDGPTTVLDWGAAGSAFVRAISAVSAETMLNQPRIEVHEVEVLGHPVGHPLVASRGPSILQDDFHFVLVQLPEPSRGRGGHRDTHKSPCQVALHDLGRLGSNRWRKAAVRVVDGLCEALEHAKEFGIVIPLFERVASTRFLDATDLGDHIAATVASHGLTPSHDFVVVPTAKEDPRRWRCLCRHQPEAGADNLRRLIDEVSP